ncbi:MAG: hypothetical protein AAGA30_07845 [Planctomycetota bacterium]
MSFIKNQILNAASTVLPTVACSTSANWLDIGSLVKAGLGHGYSVVQLSEFMIQKVLQSKVSTSSLATDANAIKRFALYPTCLEAECMPSEIVKFHEVNQKYIDKLTILLRAVRKFFELYRPSVSLIAQGYEPESALIRYVAAQYSIPVLAIENTALSDRMIWDCVSGITTNRSMSKNFFWRHEEFADEDYCSKFCEQIIESTKARKLAEHQSPENDNFQRFKNGYCLFLGQVYTDTATLFSIGKWNKPEHLLKSFLVTCKNQNLPAVIKLHPREKSGSAPIINREHKKLTWRKIQADDELFELCQNSELVYVDHDNECDTYKLMDNCRLTVTLTSQSGLESAIRGKTSIVCGPSFYSDMGFTYESYSPETFPAVFQEALAGNGDRDTILARKFATIYFEKYCKPKTMKSVFDLLTATRKSRKLFETF